jgi:hypothetical protein
MTERLTRKHLTSGQMPTGHAHVEMLTLPNPDLAISLARVEAERDALREQLEQIKEDRDHWRELAKRQQEILEGERRRGLWKRLFGRSP